MAIYNTPQPWREQFLFNSSQTAALGSWTTVSSALLSPRWGASAVLAKGFVFVFQGRDVDDTPLTSILRAPIGSDGVIGTFVAIGNVPNTVTAPSRYDAQAIVLNDVVYILGGTDGSTGLSTTSVISCPINSSGALGTWANGNSLAVAVSNFSVFCVANVLYAILGAAPACIQKAAVAPGDGSIGAWSVHDVTAPPLQGLGASCVLGANVYFIGGFDFYGSKSAVIYKATVDGAGALSAFSEYGVSLPVALSGHQVVTAEGKLYVIGGNGAATVYQASVDASGEVGAFSACPSLPGNRYASPAVVTSSRVYLLGGRQTPWEGYYSSTLHTTFSGGLNDYTGYDSEEEVYYGAAVITEAADDVAGGGITYNAGQVVVDDPLDDLTAGGSSGVSPVVVDEPADTVSLLGWSAVAGIVSIQEDLDTIGVTAYSPNIGQIAILEELDTVNVISFETGSAIQGIVSVEEYVDRLAIVGSNQANKILIAENVDEVSVAATIWNVGIIQVLEYLDVVSSQMVIGESRGSVAITEVVDSVSSVATTSNVGKVLITCGLDNVDITSTTEQLNVGAINITEPADDVSSIAIVCIGATVNITDPNDEISGDIASGNHGMISIQEELDVIKVNTKIIMPALEFSRPLSDVSVVTPALPLGVLHFDRGSITSTSIITAPSIEPLNFTR